MGWRTNRSYNRQGCAAGLVIIPEPVTTFLTEGILSIKDFIGSLAKG